MAEHLTLTAALKTGRLSDFVDQAEAEGVGPVSEADFERLAEAVIKQPRSTGRTSRSASRDGLTGR